MKNIIATVLLPLLAGLAFSCTSTTALQSTETDDLYYASSDKTSRPGLNNGGYEGTYENEVETSPEAVENPEYSEAGSGQGPITNNYNYYDNDRYDARGYSSARFRNYNYYGADPFYDPFYSPFGYSAVSCYNFYDPFWYPYCYPSHGVTISIGYSFGYPGYGHYYGYRPYGYGYPYDYYGYGGGYGGYYQGFYDGYYAGGGYGYGYRRVNYAPRNSRGNVPVNVPANSAAGRPAVPGRIAQPNQAGSVVLPAGGRPHRVAQPGTSSPGQPGQPANVTQPQNGRAGESGGRPQRSNQNVQPQNYQFQNTAPQNIDYSRPVRDNATVPSQPRPGRVPAQEVTPMQEAAPVQREQSRGRERSRPTNQPSEQRSAPAPVYENSRPSRNDNSGGSNQAPSRGVSPGGSGNFGGGGMGRPRR